MRFSGEALTFGVDIRELEGVPVKIRPSVVDAIAVLAGARGGAFSSVAAVIVGRE